MVGVWHAFRPVDLSSRQLGLAGQQWFDPSDGTIPDFFQLSVHQGRLPAHDLRLSKVNQSLRCGHYQEGNSEHYLDPMREPEINEPFRGLPIATGWLLGFLSLGIWVAAHAYLTSNLSLLAFSPSFLLSLRYQEPLSS